MARRKHDEGSVFRRKDGRYVAQVRLENGKKKQRYFKTEKEANTALRKMLHDKHIIPALGHIRVQRLTPQQVQAFYASKLQEGFGAYWVKKFHIVLHAALENAVRWNLVVRNVCDLVTPPVPQNNEIQPLTSEQVRRLLEAARGDKLEAFITVL